MAEDLHIPKHVAIIMDGNGRWAAKHNHERLWGHSYGVESLRAVVKKSVDLGIQYLTVYAFSTENWGRPTAEVNGIMALLSTTISNECQKLAKEGVKLKFIGDRSTLAKEIQVKMQEAESLVIDPLKLTLVIALNYSSRWEITQAVKKIAGSGIDVEKIDEQLISDNLTTAGIPDPDLLIRTSGEIRLSNFLLWQLSYTEMYFTDTYWPDFCAEPFEKAILAYSNRKRRWGKL